MIHVSTGGVRIDTETSTPTASLALWDERKEEVIWENTFETKRAHNAKIFHPLQEVMESFGHEIRRIVVGLGPGSYSGVRVGIAVANGLALGLDCKSVGASSLLAYGSDAEHYVVVSDARRGTLALSEIRGGKQVVDTLLLPKAEALGRIDRWESSGVICLTAEEALSSSIEGMRLVSPKASILCQQHESHQMADKDESLEPIYLRPPFITKARQ